MSKEYLPELESLESQQMSRGDRYCHPVICEAEPIPVENSINDWIQDEIYLEQSKIR